MQNNMFNIGKQDGCQTFQIIEYKSFKLSVRKCAITQYYFFHRHPHSRETHLFQHQNFRFITKTLSRPSCKFPSAAFTTYNPAIVNNGTHTHAR